MRQFAWALSVAGLAVLTLRAYGSEVLPVIKLRRSIALNDGATRSVAVSPNGHSIAACGDRLVQLLDLKTGDVLYRFNGHTGAVLSVAFSPDGKLLASCGKEKAIRLWNVNTGGPEKVLPLDEFRFQREQIRRVVFLQAGSENANFGDLMKGDGGATAVIRSCDTSKWSE